MDIKGYNFLKVCAGKAGGHPNSEGIKKIAVLAGMAGFGILGRYKGIQFF